jgi:HAD superfamily hydrolase (TIGR01509 family)
MTAAIFDCDGTLVDSEPLARTAWERTLARHGYTATDEDFTTVTGLPYARTHAYFAKRVDLPSAEAVWVAYSEGLYELFDTSLTVFADAVGAVHELRARGIRVAVASSSRRERLDRTLARAGLADLFEVTVAGDEIEHGKPAPDMFLVAAERLGVAPEGCVAIEDSPPGVAAALAAGMVTIGVRREPGAVLDGAHVVVDELSADVILAMAAANA